MVGFFFPKGQKFSLTPNCLFRLLPEGELSLKLGGKKKCFPREFYKNQNFAVRFGTKVSQKLSSQKELFGQCCHRWTSEVFFYVLSLCDLKVKGLKQREWELEQREPSTRNAWASVCLELCQGLGCDSGLGTNSWKTVNRVRNWLEQLVCYT